MTGEHECNALDPVNAVRLRIEADRKDWIKRDRIGVLMDVLDVSVISFSIAVILYCMV